MNFISSNMRFLRVLAGYTQNELAQKVGTNRANIASYERGISTPNVDLLLKLSNCFNVELTDFIQVDLPRHNLNGYNKAAKNGRPNQTAPNLDTSATAAATAKQEASAKQPQSMPDASHNAARSAGVNDASATALNGTLEGILEELESFNKQYSKAVYYNNVSRIANSMETLAQYLSKWVDVNARTAK